MKKIFMLMLIMGFFSPLINAYEYLFFTNNSSQYSGDSYRWFMYNNQIVVKAEYMTDPGQYHYQSGSIIYSYLNLIRRSYSTTNTKYISKSEFDNILKSDLQFLNDWYVYNTNFILNYLYNENEFSSNNFLQYENYELLYNSDGLAVESIVDGVWAGLYDDNEKQFSGKLYSADGALMYNNGVEVDYVQIFFDKLISKFDTTLVGVFWIMGTVVAFGVIAYYVLDTLLFVVNIAVNVFTGVKYGKVNWW